MRIEDAMTRQVITCSRDDSLEQAARQMWEHDVGCLVVVDDAQRPVGMLTDRDIVVSAYVRAAALSTHKVETAMSPRVITCFPGTRMQDVEQLMKDNRVRRIPVVDSDGCLLGIVGLGDLVRAIRTSPVPQASVPGILSTLDSLMSKRAEQSS